MKFQWANAIPNFRGSFFKDFFAEMEQFIFKFLKNFVHCLAVSKK
jgi:hypothetical protein